MEVSKRVSRFIGIIGALLLLLLPYQLPQKSRLEVGTAEAESQISGFSFPETSADGQTFRWSEAEGKLHFSDLANRPLRVRLRFHALRPSNPPTVTVTLNGHPLAALAGSGSFADVEIAANRAQVGMQGNALLAIETTPFQAPPDPRQLGVALAWVEVIADQGLAIPSLPAVQQVLLPLMLVVLTTTFASWRWKLSQTVRLLATLFCAAIGAMLLWQAPTWLKAHGWQLAGTLWGGTLLLAWGPRLFRSLRATMQRTRLQNPRVFWLAWMVAGFFLLYLPLMRTTGYWGDIEIYMAWTHQIVHHGIHNVYAFDAVARPNTTPGLFYPFWVAGKLFQRFFSPEFPPPWIDRTNQDALRFLLRLPAMLAILLTTWIVYRLGLRKGGRDWAWLSAAAFFLNPAIIFESAYYGQTGTVHGLFMFLGVVGLAEGFPAWGWAALAVGMLTKPQAYLFLPIFGIVTLWRYGWWRTVRAGLAAGLVAVIMLAPFLLNGTIGELWERISRLTEYHPFLSATAHNIWWLLSLGNGKSSDLAVLPLFEQLGWSFLTYRTIGLGLVALSLLLVTIRLLRTSSPQKDYLAFAYFFTAFFMFATQIHENHLIPMFPLLLVAAVHDKKSWQLYWLFAIAATLNMALHYPQILQVLVPQNPDVWGGAEMALPRWLSSLFQVGLFVYWSYLYWWRTEEKVE